MKILGISCFYHEAAACLLDNGHVIAASAEERFSRIKHDPSFPTLSIKYCLDYANLDKNGLDYVVFYEKPFLKFERNLTLSLKYFPESYNFFVDSMRNLLTEKLWVKSLICSNLSISSEKVLFVPHHLSHASASYYSSPFKKAAFLTLDGVGEWSCGSWGIAEDNKIFPKAELRFPHSVGLLYSTFTAFLGFEVNDGEYRVMGMAAYGKPRYISKIKKLYKQLNDGSIKLNLSYFLFYKSTKSMYSEKFSKEFENVNKFDLAASLQHCIQEIIINILNHIHKQTKEENLAYGGGVALNSVANALIIKNTPFKSIFVYPAAGDDGGSVGASLFVYHHVLGYKKREKLQDVFLGVKYSQQEINDACKIGGHNAKFLSDDMLLSYIAMQLAGGKTIGWFEGKAEFGPRALGHRSILSSPTPAEMKDKINAKIKFREEFRPFASVILSEFADEYFSNIDINLSPFMLGTFVAKSKAIKHAPATVHLDNTSRIQVISKDYPGRLRKLLELFYNKTGIPILLNTSFNLKGEPIVNSPEDALKTFERSGLDILVLENTVIIKT